MKRRVCSYDRYAIPDLCFVLNDAVGEIYFYNLRCSAEDKTRAYALTIPTGEEHQFTGIVDVARWATATAFE